MCLHRKKYHDIKNKMYEECHGYYLSEYDIYCTKCGKLLGHWAYGSAEPEFIIKYQLKGIKKIITWFRYYILKNI